MRLPTGSHPPGALLPLQLRDGGVRAEHERCVECRQHLRCVLRGQRLPLPQHGAWSAANDFDRAGKWRCNGDCHGGKSSSRSRLDLDEDRGGVCRRAESGTYYGWDVCGTTDRRMFTPSSFPLLSFATLTNADQTILSGVTYLPCSEYLYLSTDPRLRPSHGGSRSYKGL